MQEEKLPEPLDLSSFDHLSEPVEAPVATPAPASTQLITAADARLAATPPSPRLVEVANLSPEDLAAASASAAKIDFRRTDTLLSHGDHVLAEIAQSSRQLLAGVRLGDAGEVGRIARRRDRRRQNSSHPGFAGGIDRRQVRGETQRHRG